MNENPNEPNKPNGSSDTNDANKNADRIKTAIPRDKIMTVSTSPHIRSGETTRTIMTDVIIALSPVLVWSVYIFGFRALTLTLVSVISCVLFEFLFQKIMKKQVTVKDRSAVVTGILLAFNLPVNTPLWAPVIGAAFAIIIVKQLFGGIGKNIVNPAIAARVFMSLSFSFMGEFHRLFDDSGAAVAKLPALGINVDAVAGPTPLYHLKDLVERGWPKEETFDMFLGQQGGCIGEVSALLIIAGGIYLMWRKIITWHTPVSFIAVVALVTFFFPQGTSDNGLNFALAQILSGGLFLGAVFMATDYSTSPITKTGKLIFGAGCGLITVFIRYFGAYPEGVSYSIMIMNLFVWYIDKATKPVKFGGASNGRK